MNPHALDINSKLFRLTFLNLLTFGHIVFFCYSRKRILKNVSANLSANSELVFSCNFCLSCQILMNTGNEILKVFKLFNAHVITFQSKLSSTNTLFTSNHKNPNSLLDMK